MKEQLTVVVYAVNVKMAEHATLIAIVNLIFAALECARMLTVVLMAV
jgi:hypothetical protein